MNIYVGLTLVAVLAAMLVVSSSSILQDADARDSARDRANNNLDKHIEAGGAHGEAAQKIKDRLNDDGPPCTGCGDPCPTCG